MYEGSSGTNAYVVLACIMRKVALPADIQLQFVTIH